MKLSAHFAVLLLALGCGAHTTPRCEGEVTAVLSSVTLARDCPDATASALSDESQGRCMTDFCPSLCRQTSMQLSFDSTATTPAKVEIRAVRLLNFDTRAVIDNLSWREPTVWRVDKYVTWDEQVPRGESLKTSYKLSDPKYFGTQSDSSLAVSYKYIVEVDVAIDGEVRTLAIEAQREPEVAT